MKLFQRLGDVLWHPITGAILLLMLPVSAIATAADEPPQLLLCAPVAVVPGQTTKVMARGLHLEKATAASSSEAEVNVKLIGPGVTEVLGLLDIKRFGNSRVELEISVPANYARTKLVFMVQTPSGPAEFELPVVPALGGQLEIEPNPGFSQSQELSFPSWTLGLIDKPQDVDVYTFHMTAGEQITLHAAAAKFGSPLDPLLSIYDAKGQLIATSDDFNGSPDSQLEFHADATGRFHLVVQDAQDTGGPAHAYQLILQRKLAPVSFIRDIAPILQRHCVACHGRGKLEGGYRVDCYEQMMLAGESGSPGFSQHDLESSESYRRIVTSDVAERMPHDGERLTEDQISQIRQWIEAGAPFDGNDPAASLSTQIPPLQHRDAPTEYAATIPVGAIAFSPSGTELYAGGYFEVTVWDPTNGQLLSRIGNVGQRVSSIGVHPTSGVLAVASGIPSEMGDVRIFSPSGELLRVLAPSTEVVLDVAYNHSGDRLAVASADGNVRLFDGNSGDLQLEIAAHTDWVLTVAWSHDATRIASGSRDKLAKVFDTQNGELVMTYVKNNASVRGVVFHPTGTDVFSTGDNRQWERWRVADGEKQSEFALGGESYRIAATEDTFFVPSIKQPIRQFHAADGKHVRDYAGVPGGFIASALHAPSAQLAGSTLRGEICVWKLSPNEPIKEGSPIATVPASVTFIAQPKVPQ